ncbi:MAG: phosphatase PAP2 family protein [Proteobacteria bacterium]|nr:phosphatase PAP2 family protein [Pseudomonadota bacterium]
MMSEKEANRSQKPWGQVFLILLFPVIMIPLGFMDVQWTVLLYNTGFEDFGKLTQRTLFNGSKPGLSDPAIILQLVNLGCYLYYSRQRKLFKMDRYRPFWGFMIFCSLFTGLGLVHSFKWVLGRARPYLVLDGKLAYSSWYEFGSQFVTDGIFYGSFPSGHTATVFLLVTLSYFLIANSNYSTKIKVFGWIWGVIVLIMTGMMILGRSITLHHWLTDSVGIMLLSWIFIHLIYFRILNIPAQIRYVENKKQYPPLPRYWELSLLWRLFLITIGLMSICIGGRAPFIEGAAPLSAIVLPGVLLVFIFSKNFIKTYRLYMSHFQPFATI